MLKLTLPVLLMLSTAACVTGTSSACPRVTEWTSAEQIRAADELQVLPKDGMIRGYFMPDYAQLRAGARACSK